MFLCPILWNLTPENCPSLDTITCPPNKRLSIRVTATLEIDTTSLQFAHYGGLRYQAEVGFLTNGLPADGCNSLDFILVVKFVFPCGSGDHYFLSYFPVDVVLE